MRTSSGDDRLQPDDTLDHRLEQEETDPVAGIDHTEQAHLDEMLDPDDPTDPSDGWEVGDERTGRLTEPVDADQLPAAEEVGVDAGAASAERAAMHTVEEEDA